MTEWLVDGNNVMGTRPDGWWRDRPGARRRLVGEVAAWQARGGAAGTVTVVFDGHEHADEVAAGQAAGVAVRFAPGARNAADDAIVALVGAAPDPTEICVTTSDGVLADRVRALGAMVVGAGSFLSRLQFRPGPPDTAGPPA